MVGRPQETEAAPYYFTYINKVSGDDINGILEAQLRSWLAWLSGISEDQSLYRYAPDKWSIRQVLNHVTDTERAFAFRVLWFARGFDTPLPSYDQNVAAAGARADLVSWSAHVEEFRHVRMASLALFKNLPPDAWLKAGIASGNHFTVRALAYIVAGHVTHHHAVLVERYMPSQAGSQLHNSQRIV